MDNIQFNTEITRLSERDISAFAGLIYFFHSSKRSAAFLLANLSDGM